MIYNLKGKVVIITGSEGDIGRELVKRFKEKECIVYGNDIKNGDDVTNYEVMKEGISQIYEREHHIDILINNAGITLPNSYEESQWDKTIEVNLKAPFMLSKIVSEYMKQTGGSIINITSLWSELGGKNNPAYGASKGGLKQLTKCLAYDLAPYNIRVNNVGFGYIKTKMTEKNWDDLEKRKEIEKRTMLGRWGTPQDVVGLIVFLCSDEASYIDGANFIIDGGFLAKGV
jgi:NAD(P)-dependent dehydrogenase (short-subunit alcohol dehydrogenase family)